MGIYLVNVASLNLLRVLHHPGTYPSLHPNFYGNESYDKQEEPEIITMTGFFTKNLSGVELY